VIQKPEPAAPSAGAVAMVGSSTFIGASNGVYLEVNGRRDVGRSERLGAISPVSTVSAAAPTPPPKEAPQSLGYMNTIQTGDAVNETSAFGSGGSGSGSDAAFVGKGKVIAITARDRGASLGTRYGIHPVKQSANASSSIVPARIDEPAANKAEPSTAHAALVNAALEKLSYKPRSSSLSSTQSPNLHSPRSGSPSSPISPIAEDIFTAPPPAPPSPPAFVSTTGTNSTGLIENPFPGYYSNVTVAKLPMISPSDHVSSPTVVPQQDIGSNEGQLPGYYSNVTVAKLPMISPSDPVSSPTVVPQQDIGSNEGQLPGYYSNVTVAKVPTMSPKSPTSPSASSSPSSLGSRLSPTSLQRSPTSPVISATSPSSSSSSSVSSPASNLQTADAQAKKTNTPAELYMSLLKQKHQEQKQHQQQQQGEEAPNSNKAGSPESILTTPSSPATGGNQNRNDTASPTAAVSPLVISDSSPQNLSPIASADANVNNTYYYHAQYQYPDQHYPIQGGYHPTAAGATGQYDYGTDHHQAQQGQQGQQAYDMTPEQQQYYQQYYYHYQNQYHSYYPNENNPSAPSDEPKSPSAQQNVQPVLPSPVASASNVGSSGFAVRTTSIKAHERRGRSASQPSSPQVNNAHGQSNMPVVAAAASSSKTNHVVIAGSVNSGTMDSVTDRNNQSTSTSAQNLAVQKEPLQRFENAGLSSSAPVPARPVQESSSHVQHDWVWDYLENKPPDTWTPEEVAKWIVDVKLFDQGVGSMFLREYSIFIST
jgi:hypothetical protein